MKIVSPDGFSGGLTLKTLKKEITPVLHELLQKRETERGRERLRERAS